MSFIQSRWLHVAKTNNKLSYKKIILKTKKYLYCGMFYYVWSILEFITFSSLTDRIDQIASMPDRPGSKYKKRRNSFSIHELSKIYLIPFSPTKRWGKRNILVNFPIDGVDMSDYAIIKVESCRYNLYEISATTAATKLYILWRIYPPIFPLFLRQNDGTEVLWLDVPVPAEYW